MISSIASRDKKEQEVSVRLAEHMYRLAEASYQQELARESALNEQSSQLLSCIAILSVAFLTPASALFDFYGKGPSDITSLQIRLAWFYAVVLDLQVAALLFVLSAKRLRRMNLLESPSQQSNYVNGLFEQFKLGEEQLTPLELAENYCQGIDGKFAGLLSKNNSVETKLKIAMVLISASCIAAAVFGFIMLIEL